MRPQSVTLFLLLVLFAAGVFAADKGLITGKVVEQVGGLAIISAIIALYESRAEHPPSLNMELIKSRSVAHVNYTQFIEDIHFRMKNYSTSNVTLSLNYRFTKIKKVPSLPESK